MPKFSAYTYPQLKALQQKLRDGLSGFRSLDQAAQSCAQTLYAEFQESLALVRVYATIQAQHLPQHEADFARAIAQAKGVSPQLAPATPCLTLLGTKGQKPRWSDRTQSLGHRAIPLTSARFLDSIPMVAALAQAMGLRFEDLIRQEPTIEISTIGNIAGVFYVRDAQSATDSQGRLIIPARDFVHEHNIKTVFGIGGEHINGSFLILLFFTTETLERSRAEDFASLMSVFKVATMNLAMQRRFF